MTKAQKAKREGRRRFRQVRSFLHNYTEGVSSRELRRLFQEDASEAYTVLTRDQDDSGSAGARLRTFFNRARILFLGLSYKLTPARRMLFAAALVFLGLGLIGGDFRFSAAQGSLAVDFSPAFFVASIAALIFVLAFELVDRVRVRDELEVARQLQADILPRDSPRLAGYRIAHSYRTANTVGGDYYDFPLLPGPLAGVAGEGADKVALIIGDASGHGIAAGLLMAIADATVKTALDLDPSPPAVAALLNRALCRTGGRRAFMTFFYALLDPETGGLDFLCAGHPFPLLRRSDGRVLELGRGGLPLGMREDLKAPTGSSDLAPGEILVLYTDGFAEAVDGNGRAFGFDRLEELIAAEGDAETLHDRLWGALDLHLGDAPLNDDVTLVVLERRS